MAFLVGRFWQVPWVVALAAGSSACGGGADGWVSCDSSGSPTGDSIHYCIESPVQIEDDVSAMQSLCAAGSRSADAGSEPPSTFRFSRSRCATTGVVAGCRRTFSDGYTTTTWYYADAFLRSTAQVQAICSQLGDTVVLP